MKIPALAAESGPFARLFASRNDSCIMFSMSSPSAEQPKIIEVAMEIAYTPSFLDSIRQRFGYRQSREAAMSTSVGGIGPLLRERIVAQSERSVPVIGVTLLYETTWIQSWFDWGQLHLEKREVGDCVREFLKDTGMTLSITMYDDSVVQAKVWEATYGRAPVYFLDCPPLTHVVYPSDEDAPPKQTNPGGWAEELRFKQSWLVGRGTLALAKALGFQPDVIVLSETPTVFGHHRFVFDTFHDDAFFERTKYIFNDHTPLEYAHPIWPKPTTGRLKIDTSSYIPVPGQPDRGDIDVTRLIIEKAEGVFGVSAKHGRVMRAMPSLKDYGGKIDSITNGIYVPYWQAPEFKKADGLSDAELLDVRKKKKHELLDWIWRHYGLWHTWKQQVQDKPVVLWTRRITGYKRMDLLGAICRDPGLKRQLIETDVVMLIGGRIHQHDDQAQGMVYNLLDAIAGDKTLQERVLFLDNFNVAMAPRLFQGADGAIMLADDGREASATGFMKAQVNGNLIIATEDGAIPESVIFKGREKAGETPNGFEVPYANGHPTTEGLLQGLRALSQVVKSPALYAPMIRSALRAQSQVSIDRTIDETLPFYRKVLETDAAASRT
jgi:starch phosphorylase